jgi:DNA polymerase-1
MLDVQAALLKGKFKSRLLLQVHDELILEVVTSEIDTVSALVRSAMGGAYPLKAPLDVSVGIGKSWNEAAH